MSEETWTIVSTAAPVPNKSRKDGRFRVKDCFLRLQFGYKRRKRILSPPGHRYHLTLAGSARSFCRVRRISRTSRNSQITL
jgi:hypothetical protein